jgi:uncharacterized protein (TIGR02996 family)
MRKFTYSDTKSNKYWNIELTGSQFTVTYGRVGSTGQTQTKAFKDAAAAKKEHDKLVKEKLAKGYVEDAPTAKPQPRSMREALEEALVANPDDLASHMAYADYLAEQGDPRGELVRVQLALEDEGKSAAERKKLRAAEKKLLQAHEAEWLTGLAPYLTKRKAVLDDAGGEEEEDDEDEDEDEGPKYDYGFARGWHDRLSVGRLSVAFAAVLARAPAARLLRELSVVGSFYDEEITPALRRKYGIPEHGGFPALSPLRNAPSLANVRVFRLGEDQGEDYAAFGCNVHTRSVPDLVAQMPRLEELYVWANEYDPAALFQLPSLGNLRVLKLYHLDVPHRLSALAANPALGRLTHLLFHPHFYKEGALGDPIAAGEQEGIAYLTLEDVRALLRSPHLTSLTHLQLRLCSMGDEGCREIVRSGVLRRLKGLDLRHGRITDEGARALADCKDLGRLEYLDVERNGLTKEGVGRLKKVGIKSLKAANQMTTTEALEGQYLYEGDFE